MSSDEGGETATMPTTNGELHPPSADSSAPSSPGKRKRMSSPDGRSAQENASASQEKNKVEETLRYLVKILSKDDTDLQLLKFHLPSASPSKPRSKRAKLSDEKDEHTTIESRVASGHYKSIQEFLEDVEKASTGLIERQQSQGAVPNGVRDHTGAASVTELVNRIAAFKRHMNDLLVQTSYLNKPTIKTEPSEEDAEITAEPHAPNTGGRQDKTVLTLFGNPSNPKQLFSSLQQSTKVPLAPSEPGAPRYVEVQAPLRENALPNGISTTKVVPYNLATSGQNKTKTIGEVFAPRPGLPQLEPPRRARAWARDSSNMWIDPFEAVTSVKSIPGERNNYCFASLPSGYWLQYGGITSSPSYWARKQKPSATHNGEVDPAQKQQEGLLPPEDDPAALQGVYSSFAPSFDSSGAIVQADSKDLVWWAKRGAKRFRTLLSLANPVDTVSEEPAELDEDSLEETVKTFKPEEISEEQIDKPTDEKESKDMDEVLRDISELLETLNSYQQIRNLDFPSASAQNADSKDTSNDVGTPSTPSAAERSIYETLKSSLAAIISNLPPYAVAKLNGEQLADLNISQKIVVENPDYPGTMEKDDFTIQQERIAAATGANRATTPNMASTTRPGTYQGPQTPAGGYNQRAYPPNARVQPPPGGYQAPQQYYGARPSTSSPYAPAATPNYAGSRPQAPPSGQRPGYVPPYSQPGAQYNQASTLQQFQRPAQNGYSPYPAQQGPPAQGSPQPYAQRPAQPGAYNAPYAPPRSASPQKQPPYGTPQPRTPYMNPGPGNSQQRYYPQQQQPPHYGPYSSSQSSPPSTTYANSAAAATYTRSAAEQAALMDRNKAQITANQNRQNSGTPQPPAPQQQQKQQQSTEQSGSQERSVTPGNKQSSTPTPAGASQ
ncbi:hypothetical protein VTN00DRAFT_1727 [Thermoascus crustaceus]|uniref:uncharacterized protein n=1 Tax=Thermoascus crustaceus TaxID=5088 RepID=UPI003743CE74